MNPQQKHCRCKNFFASERAVSTILAFVIITGILISAFAILMAVQVPQWTKETEATHAAKVPLSFAELDSVIDMAILRDDSSSSGCRLEMMPESVPAVGVHASAGMLEFNSNSEKFSFKACAPFEVAPDDNTTHWWNGTPANFSGSEYTKFQVVTPPDRGAELALEIGEDKIFDSGGEVYLAGEFWCNNFVVKNSTTLYTSDLVIHAMKIVIEHGSEINADGLGYSGGARNYRGEGDGNGSSPMNMTGCREGNCSCGGGGGSYGGKGGDGGGSTLSGYYCSWSNKNYVYSVVEGGKGGSTYGHASMQEYHPGSGGGGGSSGRNLKYYYYSAASGGAGGGYVVLDAPVISIEGDVSADGGEGHIVLNSAHTSPGGGGGGGSGGCILLKGDDATINGSLSAKGGDGGDGRRADRNKKSGFTANGASGGGGGGGGRIKVFYDSNISSPGGLNSHTNVNGGDKGLGNRTKNNGGYEWGDDGTAGASGTIANESITYTPKVYYHTLGCLDSEAYNNTVTPLVCYGNMTWNTTVDEDTSIIMKVRSSIDKDMAYAISWDKCSPVVKGTDISDLPSVSDGHKYIQWRAEFMTFDLAKTPVLHSVNISYEYGIPFIVNTSGCIRYRTLLYARYRSELVYSQGATLKKQTEGGQPEGGLMLSAPSISISKGKQGYLNFTKLIITAINLTGSDVPPTSGFQAIIKPYDTNSELITGELYFINLTINITTEYPDVWKNWFDATSKKAGLVDGDKPGNYNITKAENRVQIVFQGNETIPVRIWLRRAEAGIEMRVMGDG